MNSDSSLSRRSFLTAAATTVAGVAAAADRDWTGKIPTRYPDPDIIALDKRFKAKLGNTPILRIHHSANTLWTEGPAWNAVGRYLLWSDIPNNLQQRWIEDDGHVSIFRNPVNNTNGNTFDYEGRQLSCEHLTRRVVRHEHNGSVTVLADKFGGKPFNAPNDVVVHPNGDIWFTDPGYGGLMNYEGERVKSTTVQPHQKEAVYVIDGKSGKIEKVTDEIFKPNGLCFSPDYKKLYVADTGASHYENAPKNIKVWDVDGKKLKGGREFCSMAMVKCGNGKCENVDVAKTEEYRKTAQPPLGFGGKPFDPKDYGRTADGRTGAIVAGFADGIRCDTEGNIWASAGWVGAGYDGVHIFAGTDGQRIGQILLPEICSNVCFGGAKRNRLFMTASTSVYAVYVETQGAHIT
ncbi:MAG: gluconolactonase [Limisphaerales bacterium]|nr:MAG: gluconolactonase [Limisphaerales bacterium]KAG0507426.1 MAG: gluconolactonase [Limisphaerales bacterium]TXT51437.1 MAG: gluconolactonase [Limisphaerales bacterium]